MDYHTHQKEVLKQLAEFERTTGNGNVKNANVAMAKIVKSLLVMLEYKANVDVTPLVQPVIAPQVSYQKVVDKLMEEDTGFLVKNMEIENSLPVLNKTSTDDVKEVEIGTKEVLGYADTAPSNLEVPDEEDNVDVKPSKRGGRNK